MNFNIITIAIVVAFILRIVKAKKEEAAARENAARENATGENVPREKVVNKNKKWENTSNTSQTFASLAKVDSPDEPRVEESMKDYQVRKSYEEDVVRQRNAWEVQREEQRNVGDLRMAKRVILGDPILPGNTVVTCSYCGAENMVARMSHEKQHCYFCRTSLPRN